MIKPQDNCPAFPEQKAVIRVENCCLYLREIISNDLYMELRKAVFKWDTAHCPHEQVSQKMAETVRARWAKR